MMDTAIAAASKLLWSSWQEGAKIGDLVADQRPTSRAEGYALQRAVWARSQHKPTGWKIAATSSAGQGHIGVSGPIAGRLLGERTFGDGASLTLKGNEMRVAEPEFAFQIGKDIAPRSTEYSVTEALEAVSDLYLAIEVPDSRFAKFETAGEAQLIADNACAHDFVLGPVVKADWRAVDLSKHATLGEIAGKLRHEGSGGNVLGDPRIALAWLVNELTRLGIEVKAGEIITTGTSTKPLPIVPGDRVIADFGAFGRVSASFTV